MRYLIACLLVGCALEVQPEGYVPEDAGVTESALSGCPLGVCGLPVRCSENVGNTDVRSVSVTTPVGSSRSMDLPSPHQQSWVSISRTASATYGTIGLRTSSTTCHLVDYRIRAFCQRADGSSYSRNRFLYGKHWFAPGDGVTNSTSNSTSCPSGEKFLSSVVDGTVYGVVYLK